MLKQAQNSPLQSGSMPIIADLILIALFVLLCWKLTDGFRRDVAFMLPLLAVAALIRFVVLPVAIKSLLVF